MGSCKLLDGVIVVFMGSDSLVFLDLRLDGGFLAKITSSIFLELLGNGVLDHKAALSRSDVPFIRLNTISVGVSRIGGRMRGIVSEALSSTRFGVIDAGKYIESNRTGLVLHSGGIITDGAVMCHTRENTCPQVRTGDAKVLVMIKRMSEIRLIYGRSAVRNVARMGLYGSA